MKVKNSSFLLEFSISGLQILITLLLVFLLSRKHINLYQVHWLALPVLFGALCFTRKNRTLSVDKQSLNKQALLKIIIFQLLLFLTFYGISPLFGPDAFARIIPTMTWHLGFFPWSLMLLIALGLRLLNNASHKNASVVDVITQIIPLKEDSYFLSAFHLLIRGATNFNIALTLALISLNIYTDFTGPLDSFSIRSLLLTLLLIGLIFSKRGKYLSKKAVQSSRWLYITTPLYAVTLSLLLSLIAHALSGIATLHTQRPTILNLLNYSLNTNDIITLFGYGWWLTWTSIGGIFIAHYSRELTLKQMLLFSSITPLLINTLLTYIKTDELFIPHSWSVTIAIMGIGGLLKLLTENDILPCLILAYFSDAPHPKHRAHQFLFTSNIKTMLIILFFSLPIGLKALSFFCCFISLPLEVFSVVIIIAVALLLRYEQNT